MIKLTPKQLAKMLQGQQGTRVVRQQGSNHNQRQATSHSGTYRNTTGSLQPQRQHLLAAQRLLERLPLQQLRQRIALRLLGRQLALRRLGRRLLVREGHAKGRRP